MENIGYCSNCQKDTKLEWFEAVDGNILVCLDCDTVLNTQPYEELNDFSRFEIERLIAQKDAEIDKAWNNYDRLCDEVAVLEDKLDSREYYGRT